MHTKGSNSESTYVFALKYVRIFIQVRTYFATNTYVFLESLTLLF